MKHMKKIVSLVLGLALMLSLGTLGFAAESGDGSTPVPPSYADMSTVTVSKTYKLTNEGNFSPAETFEFSTLTCTGVENAGVGSDGNVITKDNAPVPTIASVHYDAGEAGSVNAKKDITITLPSYTAVGVYTYTFKETDNGTAGVTYRSEDIILKVTVIQEKSGKLRVAAVHTEGEGETKSGAFDNEYSAGSLDVKKVVSGIMGDQEKEFSVTVTFTAPEGDTVKSVISYMEGEDSRTINPADWKEGTATANITLKHDATVTFTNIPYGVTYEVEEADYSADGYNTTYNGKAGTISAAAQNTMICNDKGGTVDTGIYTDTLPYILLLAVIVLAAFVFISKKHCAKD